MLSPFAVCSASLAAACGVSMTAICFPPASARALRLRAWRSGSGVFMRRGFLGSWGGHQGVFRLVPEPAGLGRPPVAMFDGGFCDLVTEGASLRHDFSPCAPDVPRRVLTGAAGGAAPDDHRAALKQLSEKQGHLLRRPRSVLRDSTVARGDVGLE